MVGLIAGMLALGTASGAGGYDHNHTDVEWNTLETDHFFIHWPESKLPEDDPHWFTTAFTAGQLARIAEQAASADGGIGSRLAALNNEQLRIGEDEEKLEARMVSYEARLKAQFGAMEAAVAGFKSTQDFLDQQIKMWTSSEN